MEQTTTQTYLRIYANGTCPHCGKIIRKIDREDDNCVFYLVRGLKIDRGMNIYLIRCRYCKQYIEL